MRQLLFASLMIVSLPAVTLASFSDVPFGDPHADAIGYVEDQGIVSGYPDGTFRSTSSINRAEFVKILTKASMGEQIYVESVQPWKVCNQGEGGAAASALFRQAIPFADVEESDWFSYYVCVGVKAKLIQGYPDGSFKSSKSINFAEAAKIIAKAFQLPITETNVWYEGYARALADRKAIPLSVYSFGKQLTRGEMAEMIYRIRANVTDKPSKTYEELENNAFLYQNARLGFAMKLPRETSTGLAGQKAPVVVLDDGTSDHVYVVPEQYIPLPRREPLLRSTWEAMEAMEESSVTGWKITVAEAASENDVLRFIRSQFGSTCTIGGYAQSAIAGVEDITIGNARLDQGDCFVNYQYQIKYSPSLRRIASWDTNDKGFSLEWAKSFRFVPPTVISAPLSIAYRNTERGFTLRLPEGSTRRENEERFDLPFTHGTTLYEKFLTITTGANETSDNCSAVGFMRESSSTVTFNGIRYLRESGSDDAMGNYYDSVRYTTGYPNYSGSMCASFTFTLHHVSQGPFDNPPPLFDREKESAVFDEVMESVKFE